MKMQVHVAAAWSIGAALRQHALQALADRRRQDHLAGMQQGRRGADEIRQGPTARGGRHDAATREGKQAAEEPEQTAAASGRAKLGGAAGERSGASDAAESARAA